MDLCTVQDLVEKKQEIKVARPSHILDLVVFVGGLPGCGKTLLTPIVGSFRRVEIQKFNYALEYVCELHFLGRLSADVSTTMVRILTDLDIYHMMMSRETNFRFKDLSSIFKNPGMWRYLRRLFYSGDDETIVRIKKERPILQLTIHNLLIKASPLFAALGDRMRIIEVIRHPLYMIKQWFYVIDRYGSDPRELTICFEHKGQAIPFFTRGWEDLYLESNSMDKVIYSIRHLTLLERQMFVSLTKAEKERVLFVPFENFVINPWPYLRQMEILLGTNVSTLTRRELKNQNVPRKMIAEGIGRPIYKKYGWEPPHKNSNERSELNRRREFVAQHASAEGIKVLDYLSEEYEKQHFGEVVKLV